MAAPGLLLGTGWELAEVCAIVSHVQVPECAAARSEQPFLGSLGYTGLEEELCFGTFPREFGGEVSVSFRESSFAPSSNNYSYEKGHTMSSCLSAPCRGNELLFSLGRVRPKASVGIWAASSVWTAVPGCTLW